MDGDTVTLDIVHNPGGLLNVIDEDNNRLALSDEGAYLCLRLKDKAKIGVLMFALGFTVMMILDITLG